MTSASKKYWIILLSVIIFIAVPIRLFQLSDNPSGFFCDEASIGYNAYTLLNQQTDEYHKKFPIFFESFGEFKTPVAIYLTIPIVAIFGLNEFSIRLLSVLFGIITVIFISLIAKELFGKKVSILTAFFSSTMPWLIHYNRTGFELNTYLGLTCLTIYLFIKSQNNNKKIIIPSFISGAITLYSYFPSRIIIPLLILGCLIIFYKKLIRNKLLTITGLLLFLVIALPLIFSFFSEAGLARFNMVSVLSQKLSPLDTFTLILKNYFTQLTPKYLLFGENTPILRHFTNGLTPLLGITIPFLYLGILSIFLKYKKTSSKILILWLTIYPLAGAITFEPPFTSRSIIGAPLFAIFISIGFLTIINIFKKVAPQKLIMALLLFAVLLNFVFFLKFYFQVYPKNSWGFWGWQYGAKEIINYFSTNQKFYDELIMAPEFNQPEIFFKFYAPNDCQKCLVGLPNDSYKPGIKQLFVVPYEYIHNNPISQYEIIETINSPSNTPAFYIIKTAY